MGLSQNRGKPENELNGLLFGRSNKVQGHQLQNDRQRLALDHGNDGTSWEGWTLLKALLAALLPPHVVNLDALSPRNEQTSRLHSVDFAYRLLNGIEGTCKPANICVRILFGVPPFELGLSGNQD